MGKGRTTLTAHEPVHQKENVHESERYPSPRAGVSGPYGRWRRTGRDRQAVQREYGVEIAGDTGVLPWIGQKSGRAAIIDFVNDSRAMIERISFEVHDILAGDDRAVILGSLASKLKPTGKIVETDFAMVLTVANGEIVRFQMLEDSFAVSQAARR